MDERPVQPAREEGPSPAEAAAEAARFLDGLAIPYVVIGGLAVQLRGEPRATHDVDITVLVPGGAERPFLEACIQRFAPRIPDALEKAILHRQRRGDLRYIRRWLREFSLVLPERDPLGAFEASLRSVRRQSKGSGPSAAKGRG